MSGAPGIVYQTSRSIRSIHCRQFYFFKFENLGEALHSFTRSKSSKFLLARKSWFSFPTITESKSTFFIFDPSIIMFLMRYYN